MERYYPEKLHIVKWEEGIEPRYEIHLSKREHVATAINKGGQPFIIVESRLSGKPKRVLVLGWDYAVPTPTGETITPHEFHLIKFHLLEALSEAAKEKGNRSRTELRHRFSKGGRTLKVGEKGYVLRRKKIERPVPVNLNIPPAQRVVVEYFKRLSTVSQWTNELKRMRRAHAVGTRIAHMLNQQAVIRALQQEGVGKALRTRAVHDAAEYIRHADFIFEQPELVQYALNEIHSPALAHAFFTRIIAPHTQHWKESQEREMRRFFERQPALREVDPVRKTTYFALPSTHKHRGARSFMFYPAHPHLRSYKPKKPLRRFVRVPF
jgi:hypothetical protein